jgi:hypothetical protein
MEKSAVFDALKDSLLKQLLPILLQRGLNMAMPELGDIIATAVENFRKELPAETLALFP